MSFYQEFCLDPNDDCTQLGIQLSAQEVRLQQMGHPETSPLMRRVRLAFGILAHEETRHIYDNSLRSQQNRSDYELEYLANFGSWPLIVPPQQPQSSPMANPFASVPPVQTPQYPQGVPMNPNPFVAPNYQVPAQMPAAPVFAAQQSARATASARMGLTLLDGVFALILVGSLVEVLDSSFLLGSLVGGLIVLAYYIAPEVLMGGTPAKLMFGYTVRDVNTGARLSWVQSAKRNWWRLAAIIPAAGPAVSFIASIAYAISLSGDSARMGGHDRIADAEVVKRAK